MREIRVFVDTPLAPGAEVELPPAASRHLGGVLRLHAGTMLTVFDGRGGEHEAVLCAVSRHAARVRVGRHRPRECESTVQLTLGQGLVRAERMDLALQKAVELGVSIVQPLYCERSVVRLDAARVHSRLTHWHAIAIGACEQCGRNRPPQLRPPVTLDDWLQGLPPGGLRLVLSPGGTVCMDDLPDTAQCVALLVGPEGGLATGEVARAQAAGFTALRLGPRVLRTETAALLAVAAIQLRYGDLSR